MRLKTVLVTTAIHKKCGGVVEGGKCSRCSRNNIRLSETIRHGAFSSLIER